MKKPQSERRLPHNPLHHHNDGIYTVRMSHFDPQIDVVPFASTRYSNEEVGRRSREAFQMQYSHFHKEACNPERQRRAKSSHQMRATSQSFTGHQLANLNKQINSISPILSSKLIELKNLVYKKPGLKRNSKDPQNVHFTEYVLQPSYQPPSSALHSLKKECPFMKSVKARHLMNRVEKSKSKGDDLFKSIELNNASKYVNSKRIIIEGSDLTSKSNETRKNLLKYGSRGHLERRKAQLPKQHRPFVVEDGQNECRPWETHVGHQNGEADDDQNIIHA